MRRHLCAQGLTARQYVRVSACSPLSKQRQVLQFSQTRPNLCSPYISKRFAHLQNVSSPYKGNTELRTLELDTKNRLKMKYLLNCPKHLGDLSALSNGEVEIQIICNGVNLLGDPVFFDKVEQGILKNLEIVSAHQFTMPNELISAIKSGDKSFLELIKNNSQVDILAVDSAEENVYAALGTGEDVRIFARNLTSTLSKLVYKETPLPSGAKSHVLDRVLQEIQSRFPNAHIWARDGNFCLASYNGRDVEQVISETLGELLSENEVTETLNLGVMEMRFLELGPLVGFHKPQHVEISKDPFDGLTTGLNVTGSRELVLQTVERMKRCISSMDKVTIDIPDVIADNTEVFRKLLEVLNRQTNQRRNLPLLLHPPTYEHRTLVLIGREFDITSTLLYLYKDIESALPDFHHFLKYKTQLAAQSFNLTREDVKEIEKLFREASIHEEVLPDESGIRLVVTGDYTSLREVVDYLCDKRGLRMPVKRSRNVYTLSKHLQSQGLLSSKVSLFHLQGDLGIKGTFEAVHDARMVIEQSMSLYDDDLKFENVLPKENTVVFMSDRTTEEISEFANKKQIVVKYIKPKNRMTDHSRLLSLGDSSQELIKFYENFAQHGTHMSVSSPTVAKYILNRLESIIDCKTQSFILESLPSKFVIRGPARSSVKASLQDEMSRVDETHFSVPVSDPQVLLESQLISRIISENPQTYIILKPEEKLINVTICGPLDDINLVKSQFLEVVQLSSIEEDGITASHERSEKSNISKKNGVESNSTEMIAIPRDAAYLKQLFSACGIVPQYGAQSRIVENLTGTVIISINPKIKIYLVDNTALKVVGETKDVEEMSRRVKEELSNLHYRTTSTKHSYSLELRHVLLKSDICKDLNHGSRKSSRKIQMGVSKLESGLKVSVFGTNQIDVEATHQKVQEFVDNFKLITVAIPDGMSKGDMSAICAGITKEKNVIAQFDPNDLTAMRVYGEGESVISAAEGITQLIRSYEKSTESNGADLTTATFTTTEEIPIPSDNQYLKRIYKNCGISADLSNLNSITFNSVNIYRVKNSALKLVGETGDVLKVRKIIADELQKLHQREIVVKDVNSDKIRHLLLKSDVHKELVSQPDSRDKVWINNRPPNKNTSEFRVSLCGENEAKVARSHQRIGNLVESFRLESVAVPKEMPNYLRSNICANTSEQSEVTSDFTSSEIRVYGLTDAVRSAAQHIRHFVDGLQREKLEFVDAKEVSLLLKLIIDSWYMRSRFPNVALSWHPKLISPGASPMTLSLLGPESELSELRTFLNSWTSERYPIAPKYDTNKLLWYVHNIAKLPVPATCDVNVREGYVDVFGSEDGVKCVRQMFDFELDDRQRDTRQFNFDVRYLEENEECLYQARFSKVLSIASNYFKEQFPLVRWHIMGKEIFFSGEGADGALSHFLNLKVKKRSPYASKSDIFTK